MQGINMSALYSATKSGLALLVIVVLLGCMEKPVVETTLSKPVQTTKTTKPGAAIKLVSSSLISITANELVDTEIFLETMEPRGELSIEFSPSQGLILKNPNTPQTIKFDSSSAIKIPVSLLATANGRYYLNMRISLNNTDSISVRNLAMIVQVGPLTEKAVKLQKTAGENIIVLPAQETISSQ
jgi:hypothetical protein